MARPLKIHTKSGGNLALQEMSTPEIYNVVIYPMLKSYALDVGAASLSADNANLLTTYSVVGTINDVYSYYEVGTHPGGQLRTSRQFQILQNQLPEAESFPRPITWTGTALKEMTTAEIDQYFIDPAIDLITAGGIGSYYITRDNYAPTHISGATWTLIAGYVDKLTATTSSAGYYLWRQINYTANPYNGAPVAASLSWVTAVSTSGDFTCASTYISPGQIVTVTGTGTGITGRPATSSYVVATTNGSTTFKLINTNGTSITTVPGEMTNLAFNFGTPLKLNTHLYELDQATIIQLKSRLKNKIISTQKGTYVLGSSAPSTGTWASMGTWYDYTRQYADLTYTGYYTGSYTGSYATGYAGSYNDTYYGGVASGTWYTGTYNSWFTGYYSGAYAGNYVGTTVLGSTENVQTIKLYVRRS